MSEFLRMKKHILNEMSFKVGEDSFTIHPVKGDKLALLEIMSTLEKSKARESASKLSDYLVSLFSRELKPESEEDKRILESFVYDNSDSLVNQLLIEFRLVTKDDLEKAKKQVAQSIEQN